MSKSEDGAPGHRQALALVAASLSEIQDKHYSFMHSTCYISVFVCVFECLNTLSKGLVATSMQ